MIYAGLSANATIDAMLFGTRWDSGAGMTEVTYSFPRPCSTWAGYAEPSEPYHGFAPLGAYEQQAVRNALLDWSSVANINFVEVADTAGGNGTIRIAYTSYLMGAHQMGYAYLPNDSDSGGDVWLNTSLRNTAFELLEPGTKGGFTLLHELGHTIGLKHPGTASADSNNTLGALEDTIYNTVMSFNAWPGTPIAFDSNIDRLPSTPMSYDIDALQYLYGPNTTTHISDDHYIFAGDGKYLQVIYDMGGNDIIELTGTQGGVIDLRPGSWSQLGLPVQINDGLIQNPDTVQIYHATLIENAIGGDGADTLVGNECNNTLAGGASNDIMEGGAGIDIAAYAGKRASFTVAQSVAGFTITDSTGAEGVDTIANIERLFFADTNIALDVADGNAGAVAKIMGIVFGRNSVLNEAYSKLYVGVGLSCLDGGMSYQELMQLALNTKLGIGFSNDDAIRLIYQNLLGFEPAIDELDYWSGLITSGQFTHASLAIMAADHELNAGNIGLAGLAQTGIEFSLLYS